MSNVVRIYDNQAGRLVTTMPVAEKVSGDILSKATVQSVCLAFTALLVKEALNEELVCVSLEKKISI